MIRTRKKTAYEKLPANLPFLQAVCWQTPNVHRMTEEEMLARYERGWNYLGVMGDLTEQERRFIRTLAARYGSWLNGRV